MGGDARRASQWDLLGVLVSGAGVVPRFGWLGGQRRAAGHWGYLDAGWAAHSKASAGWVPEVLRLDLRGHGRSAAAHENDEGKEPWHQYTWPELAKDLRLAAADSVSRSFFGGEGSGACVALLAALAANGTQSLDAPPGLVLMRPPQMLADVAHCGKVQEEFLSELRSTADLVKASGFEALERREAEHPENPRFLDGSGANFRSAAPGELQKLRRTMSQEAFAAALLGHAESEQAAKSLAERLKEGFPQSAPTMAADAYGVPMTPGCPVLVLAVPGDPDSPVEAAQTLSQLLPDAELQVADSLEHAYSTWGASISSFLRKAWMKEFLTKRVMPQ
ncbi:unnamed protein product [Effrenium voratum]|nr:unnamed protein product [Effrenium voratum]